MNWIFLILILVIFNPVSANNFNRLETDEPQDQFSDFHLNSFIISERKNEFIKDYFKNIIKIKSESIDSLKNTSHTTLQMYNDRGIASLLSGEYELGLDDFNFVIDQCSSQENSENVFLGTALWGRLFCHAFGNEEQNAYLDSLTIKQLFLGCTCSENQLENHLEIANSSDRNLIYLPIAKFAYPEENVTEWECHDRTKRIMGKMCSLSELIPYFLIRKIVIELIDELANKAHKCCNSGKHWTVCLGPIADAWLKLEDTWDQLNDLFLKGINIKKLLTAPSNL
jgi:hypothetical protein